MSGLLTCNDTCQAQQKSLWPTHEIDELGQWQL